MILKKFINDVETEKEEEKKKIINFIEILAIELLLEFALE